jgi:uncharacterized protein (TIGR04255 family)
MGDKLNKPPLVEVVCEFRFKSESWDPTIAGVLYPKLEAKFPKKESVKEGRVDFFFDGKTKGEPQMSRSESEFPKFSDESGDNFLILKKNLVSIHNLKNYQGWDDYVENIKFVLEQYFAVGKPEKIERIGLRYVNKIDLPVKDFSFSNYFNINPTLVSGIISVDDINKMQAGIVSSDNGNEIVTQFVWKENKDKKEFILDIDYHVMTLENMDIENVDSQLKKAHEKIENIFLASLTDDLITIFNA